MVRFGHRAHGGSDTVPCASCHTHRSGSTELASDPAACALCHYQDIAGTTAEPDCSACHARPQHTRLTSQGVPIAHADLDSARVSCTRCHYQLVDRPVRSGREPCSACHTEPVRDWDDTLHSSHSGFACGACHEPVRHRVVAMSTTVNLSCADCHATRHRRPVPGDTVAGRRCEDCHGETHSEAQRLVLGLLPDEPIRPSPMFMGGVTCKSCHVTPGSPPPEPGSRLVTGDAACTGCHGAQWAGYLARWRRGYSRRREMVDEYLSAAGSALGPGAAGAAASRLREAAALLKFIDRGGPLHNLAATDRFMRRALELGSSSYAAASRPVAAPPQLGPPVTPGSCLACHYGIEEHPLGRDSLTGRPVTHAMHLFGGGLACSSCHAVGAAPPGIPDSSWRRPAGRPGEPSPRR
jgi:hypothetical protein